jgi:hypothetical protein
MKIAQDREVVTLLAREPQLLAIADAVAATHAARRRLPVRSLAAVAALLAAAGLALLAPWGDGAPSVVESARAAIGSGPVLHAVVEYEGDDALVDLATGKSTPRVHRIEYWFDEERELLHTKLSTDGVQITEIVEDPKMAYSDLGSFETNGYSPQLDPALAGFATGYREALENGSAREVGKSKIGLRPVTLLAFQRGSREVLTVAVDEETGRPLRFSSTMAGGRRSHEWTVAQIETVQRSGALFARPELAPPRPTGGSQGEARPVELEGVTAAFGGQAAWLGPTFRGRALDFVGIAPTTAQLTDGKQVEGLVLQLKYGRVHVRVGRGLAGAYAVGMEDGGDPPPPPGSIAITRDIGGPRGWAGELRAHGVYVSISAPTGPELIDAARALRPLER